MRAQASAACVTPDSWRMSRMRMPSRAATASTSFKWSPTRVKICVIPSSAIDRTKSSAPLGMNLPSYYNLVVASPRPVPILVTGGAGYIGSHTTQALLDRGYDVTVVDDLSRGYKHNVAPER